MNFIESDEYLPGNPEKICLIKFTVDGAYETPEHETGFYDGVWMSTAGMELGINTVVLAWLYIE